MVCMYKQNLDRHTTNSQLLLAKRYENGWDVGKGHFLFTVHIFFPFLLAVLEIATRASWRKLFWNSIATYLQLCTSIRGCRQLWSQWYLRRRKKTRDPFLGSKNENWVRVISREEKQDVKRGRKNWGAGRDSQEEKGFNWHWAGGRYLTHSTLRTHTSI